MDEPAVGAKRIARAWRSALPRTADAAGRGPLIQVQGETSKRAIEREASERASVFDGIQDVVHELRAAVDKAMNEYKGTKH